MIDPNKAAHVLSNLLRSDPKKASSTIHTIFKESLVPGQLKEALAERINNYLTIQDDGGRHRPFEPKKDMNDLTKHYGLDKQDIDVLDQYRADLITTGLIERMGGSDADRPPDPVTREDQVRAAFETHVKE